MRLAARRTVIDAEPEKTLAENALDLLEESGYDAEVIAHRRSLLASAKSAVDRERILAECAEDPERWISDWVWTFDPRRKPSALPFILFPRQAEYLQWRAKIRRARDYGLVEKSRDAGLTWLNVASNVHSLLFEPGYKGSIGSRKEMLVDRLGDMDSIFEKMRYIMRYLPEWMKPEPANYNDGYLKLINFANGSSVTGEAGDQMGRGGRSSVYDIDEAAFIDRPKRVNAAVSDNSDVVIFTSTPNGPSNEFAIKRFSGDIPVFSFHWLQDPRKNHWVRFEGARVLMQGKGLDYPEGAVFPWPEDWRSHWFQLDKPDAAYETGSGREKPEGAFYPWYEDKKRKLDPITLAQEVDIDYNASVEGITIPSDWVRAAIGLSLPKKGHHVAGLDIADEGSDENILIVRHGPLAYKLDVLGSGNTNQTAYKARTRCSNWKVEHLNYDSIGVGAGVGGTLNSCTGLTFGLTGVVGGASPSDRQWEGFAARDGENVTGKDIFLNLRAEGWWSLRRRFERTFEHVNGEGEYAASDLISIPDDPLLISQLSQPLYSYNDRGKIVIESKMSMKKRGMKSPDRADALVYAFMDPPVKRRVRAARAIASGRAQRPSF